MSAPWSSGALQTHRDDVVVDLVIREPADLFANSYWRGSASSCARFLRLTPPCIIARVIPSMAALRWRGNQTLGNIAPNWDNDTHRGLKKPIVERNAYSRIFCDKR
jgi:hypothetical protein